MNTFTSFSVGAIFLALCSGNVLANDDSGRQRRGPPPEAFTACEGLSAGDTAEFQGPRGNAVSGTCEQVGDKLVLRPDKPRGGKGRHNRGED